MEVSERKDQVALRLQHGRNGDAAPSPAPLTIAILQGDTDQSLEQAALSIGLNVCMAGPSDLDTLPLSSPDILVVSLPGAVPIRRIGLLIAQLRWRKPDLVVLLSDAMVGMKYDFDVDVIFDAYSRPMHLHDVLLQAGQMLRLSRIAKKTSEPVPTGLLHHAAQPRSNLFGGIARLPLAMSATVLLSRAFRQSV